MQIKIIIGTVAFMLTMILLGFYALLEPARLENFTNARLGRQIEQGAEIFYANCATCHGINGKGVNGGECYDSAGEPIACQGRALNNAALLCGDVSQRMTERGWAGTKFGFVHDTINSGRQGGVMAAWGQDYGGPLQENAVRNATLFVLNWESEELCSFVPVEFPWPEGDDVDPQGSFDAVPNVTEDDIRENNPDLAPEEEIPFDFPVVFPGDSANGEDLYQNTYGCNACHGLPSLGADSASVGPWHGDLGLNADSRVAGMSAEAYIYQSIMVPEAFIVDTYSNAMQSYKAQMAQNPQDLMDIITYLLEQQGQ